MWLEGKARPHSWSHSDPLPLQAQHSWLTLRVAPLPSPRPPGAGAESSSLAAVGSWSSDISLLALPGLTPVAAVPLDAPEGVIPRSVLLAGFEGGAHTHLLVGLGDGALHSWRLEPGAGALSDKKQIQLGTKPIQLRTFAAGGVSYVFAACDRPTIIYSQARKLVYSNLNEGEVRAGGGGGGGGALRLRSAPAGCVRPTT